MKFRLTTLVVLIGLNASLFAQSTTFDNVRKFTLRNMGAITEESTVQGYYMFYQMDKIKKKTYSYNMVILDQNLNQIATKSIVGNKYLSLLDGVYNKQSLFLKFYDAKEKKVSFQEYDLNAKMINKYSREAEKAERNVIAQGQAQEGANSGLYAINDVGFIDYHMVKNKDYGFKIQFFPSNDYKAWSYTSDVNSKMVTSASLIYADENVVVNSIVKKKRLMSKKAELEVLALDTRTGKVLFQKKLISKKYELLVMNGLESDEEGNIYLFGTYYKKGDKEFSSASKGIFSMKIDQAGQVLEEKYMDWAKAVAKHLPVNQKGKMKEGGYTYFHDFVRNADGNFYAIGEQYKKRASAAGITANVLSGLQGTTSGASNSEMKISNLLIFEFDPSFELLNVNMVEKDYSTVLLPAGALYQTPHYLAHMVNAMGGFDYRYLQFNEDKSIFTVAYTYREDVKKGKDKYILGNASYVDSEFSLDKVDLGKTAGSGIYRLFPAKIGNFMMLNYNAKKKTIEMKLEKVNF